MTAASQLDVIKNDDRIFVTVADIAPILKADPLYLRETARQAPEALGFPVCVVGRREVKHEKSNHNEKTFVRAVLTLRK